MWKNIKAHAWYFVTALLALFGLGALAAAQYRKKQLEASNATLAVTEAKTSIEVLRAQRAALGERTEEFHEEIASIDRKLAQNKQTIAEVHATHGLTTEEIADEFQKLGY